MFSFRYIFSDYKQKSDDIIVNNNFNTVTTYG